MTASYSSIPPEGFQPCEEPLNRAPRALNGVKDALDNELRRTSSRRSGPTCWSRGG